MSIEIDFTRSLLRAILPEVRKADPTIKVSEAWVYKVGRDHWEFHYKDFYWHGSASNATEARFNGWERFLSKIEAPGYEKAINHAADTWGKNR